MNPFRPLVPDPDHIRLGIIGLTEGNGHPYSWSAIFNGYNPENMARRCPFPGILDYLAKEDPNTMNIPGARITHICCDDLCDAEKVAACSRIDHICATPEELIGRVDAVIIATDIGGEHVRRARPFVAAGVPVFLDKPLCDNAADLAVFEEWVGRGAAILSSSCMRYAKEYAIYHRQPREFGELRHIYVPMAKKWETYAIHALEAAYPILGPGFLNAVHAGDDERHFVTYAHRCGCHLTIACVKDMQYGGAMHLGGTRGHATVRANDTYQAFRAQLVAWVEYLRTGMRPFPWAETRELMQMVIAGIAGCERPGVVIPLN